MARQHLIELIKVSGGIWFIAFSISMILEMTMTPSLGYGMSFIIPYIILVCSYVFTTYIYERISKKNIRSNRKRDWASSKDIVKAELVSENGVVLGTNPHTGKPLIHGGRDHILFVASERTGKGASSKIPTLLTWSNSVFVIDIKGENYAITAGFRKHVLKQKVIKFEPMCDDGSSARWNPLAETHFRSNEEFSDIQNIVTMIVDPEGKGQLDYWANTGSALLIGTILHLMYAHYVEEKPLPTLTNVARFLSSPERDIEEQLELMKVYPHITPEEFLSDSNIFQEIYGEYVTNFGPYNESLNADVHTLNDLKEAIRHKGMVDFSQEPFKALLTHPRVAEATAEMLNKAPNEQSGTLSTVKTFLRLYQNPVVAQNISVSDFCIDDLLDSYKPISFYFVVSWFHGMEPLYRLFIHSVLRTLIKKIESEDAKKDLNRQRLLLVLDEFLQFGKMDIIDAALATFNGDNIKICLMARSTSLLDKVYGSHHSIFAHCKTQVFLSPGIDETAWHISKMLGTMTPDEVIALGHEREYIFVAGHKPVFGKSLRYYTDSFLKERFKLSLKLQAPTNSEICTCVDNFTKLIKAHEKHSKRLGQKGEDSFGAKRTN